MVRRLAVLCLAWVSFALPGQAQERSFISGDDTLHYVYTPLPVDSTAAAGDARQRRDPFFRRLVKYFEGSNVDRTFEKKIDFTFAGGPSYSKTTSLGIGLLAAGLYRLDRTDSVTAPSDVSLFANVSISGVYAVGVTGNTIFSQDRRRLNYTVMFSSTPRDIWGVGYNAGRYNKPVSYTEKHYLVEANYLYRILPKTYVGTVLSFEHTAGKKFSDEKQFLDLIYRYGEKTHYTATGLGVIVEYDSRDFIPNPFRGIYLSFQERIFPKGLGNCGKTLWRTMFKANAYQRVWKDCILAADLYAVFNSEGTPWPMLARLGDNQRMRGYYQGRYADNSMITMQVELRQRVWRRIGCTVWGGAGNVFSSLDRFDWSHTLPNYGLGLRWELKKRVNVRLDYGFGKDTSSFLLSVNEAF